MPSDSEQFKGGESIPECYGSIEATAVFVPIEVTHNTHTHRATHAQPLTHEDTEIFVFHPQHSCVPNIHELECPESSGDVDI